MKPINKEILSVRMKQFAERKDVRDLGILVVAGLLSLLFGGCGSFSSREMIT